MGYFSNGSEESEYQARYCARCVHDVNLDCPVWVAHLVNNYDQKDNEAVKEILSSLIPRAKGGLENEQCRMFVPLTVAATASISRPCRDEGTGT